MRRMLAMIMALVMLLTSVPALAADGSKTAAAKSAKKVDYTVSLAKSTGFEAGYAVFLKDARIFDDDQFKDAAGDADKGDVVVAVSRKGFNTDKARVKITWLCGTEVKTGWVRANTVRLMDGKERRAYVDKAKAKKKVVREDGKYLLPIPAYVKAASTAAPEVESGDRATLPKSAVTGLTTVSGGLRVKWKAVEGATKYQIFRSTHHSTGFKRIATVSAASGETMYKDEGAKRNNAYYYYIRTVFADGQTTDSAKRGRWHDFGPKISQSRNAATGAVTLSWTRKADAKNYFVYRAAEGSTSYKKIATQTALSYVDKDVQNGETYTYYIVANYELDTGKTVVGTTGAKASVFYGVKPVEVVEAANAATGVRISWKGADDATGYRVMYRVGTSGAWTKLTTTKATRLYYVHRVPAYGQVIQYTVRAEGKVNGKAVLAAAADVATHVAVGQPTLTLTPAVGKIDATWTAAKGVTRYALYYKHVDSADYTRVETEGRSAEIPVIKAGEYVAYVQAEHVTADGSIFTGRASAEKNAFTEEELPVPSFTVFAMTDDANIINLAWNAIDGAQEYDVEVKDEQLTMGRQVLPGTETGNHYFAVNEGVVMARIRVKLSGAWGSWSGWQTISADWENGVVVGAVKGEDVKVIPANTYKLVDMSWPAAANATTYRVYVLHEGNGQSKTFVAEEPSAQVELWGNGEYSIMITPVHDCQSPAGTEQVYGTAANVTLTITWPEPDAPTVTAACTDRANVISVAWTEVKHAVGYEVTVKSDSFQHVQKANGDATSLLMAVNEDTYEITVKAEMDWCAVTGQAVTLAADWADGVMLDAPTLTVSQSDHYNNTRLYWTEVPGADWYEVWVKGEGYAHTKKVADELSVNMTVNGSGDYQYGVTAVRTVQLTDGTSQELRGLLTTVTKTMDWEEEAQYVPVIKSVELMETPNVIKVTWEPMATPAESMAVVAQHRTELDIREAPVYTDGRTETYLYLNEGEYDIRVTAYYGGTWYDSKAHVINADWENGVLLDKPVFTVQQSEQYNYVDVYWTAVDQAESHRVYILGQNQGNDFNTTLTMTESPFQVELNGDGQYSFVVFAEKLVRWEGGYQDLYRLSETVEQSFTWSEEARKTPAITSLTCTETANVINVKWNDVPDAVGYEVKISGGGQEQTIVPDSFDLDVVVNGGMTYTVQVRAAFEGGQYGPWSKAKSVDASWADMVALTKPEAAFTYNPNKQEVTGVTAEGAADTLYELQAQAAGAEAVSAVNNTAAVTMALEKGPVYTVRMRLVREISVGGEAQRICGPWSDEVSIDTNREIDVTAKPANLQANMDAANQVYVTWDAAYGATKYICEINGYTEEFTTNKSRAYWFPSHSGRYTYRVKATYEVDGATYESEYAEISFEPVFDEPCIDLPQPVMTAQKSDTPNEVRITWEDIPDATGFLVYQTAVSGADASGQGRTKIPYTADAGETGMTLVVNGNSVYQFEMAAIYEGDEVQNSCFGGTKFTSAFSNVVTVEADWDEADWFKPAPTVTGQVLETPGSLLFNWDNGYGCYGHNHLVKFDGEIYTVSGSEFEAFVTDNGSYTVEVCCGYDIYDNCSPWSLPCTVTTDWDLNGFIILGKPEPDVDMSTANQFYVTWEAIEGAEKYQVKVLVDGQETYIFNTDSTFLCLNANGTGKAYAFHVYAASTHPDTGETVLSVPGKVEADATWDGGVVMEKVALSFFANANIEEMGLVECYVSWEPQENVYYELSYYPVNDPDSYVQVKITEEGYEDTYGLELPKGVAYVFYMDQYAMLNGDKVWGPTGDDFSYTPVYGADCLSVPEMTLSADEEGSICVSWKEDPKAFSYTVYYRAAGETAYTSAYVAAWHYDDAADERVPVTQWAFKGQAGKRYEVYMCANWEEDGAIDHGPACDVQSIALPLHAPVMTLAAVEEGFIDVSWQTIPGVTGYEIFCIFGDNGSSVIGNTVAGTATSFRLEVPTVHYGQSVTVWMRAWLETSDETLVGDECANQSIVADWPVELVAPVMTVSTEERGWLNVSWEAVKGATKYRLFYKLSDASGFSNMFVENGETSVKIPAANNSSYIIYMRAIHVSYDGVTTSGPTCARQTVPTAWTAKLARPTLTADMGATGFLNLAWTEISGAAGYILRYKTADETAYTEIMLTPDVLTYELPVTPETTYNLTVCAYEGDPALPYEGRVSTVTTILASWAMVKPVMTLTQGEFFRLNVSWEPVAFATRYRIFYRAEGDSGYTNMFVEGTETSAELVVANDTTYQVYMRGIRVEEDGTTVSGPACSVQTVALHWDDPVLPVPDLHVEAVSGDENETTMRFTWNVAEGDYGYVLTYTLPGEQPVKTDVTSFTDGVMDVTLPTTAAAMACEITAYMFIDETMFVGQPGTANAVVGYGVHALTVPVMTLALSKTEYELEVSWEKQDAADQYNIYYKADIEDEYSLMTVDGAAASTLIHVSSDMTYDVYMEAAIEVEGDMIAGPACDAQTIYAFWLQEMPAPTVTLTLNETPGLLDIAWSDVTYSNGTRVWYRTTEETEFTKVDLDASYISYRLDVETGKTYVIRVQGIFTAPDGRIYEGDLSAIKTILASWSSYRALLIGQTYPGTANALEGPDTDAQAVRAMLRTMSGTPYTTTIKYNLTASGILSAISSTFADANEHSVSLFYYSGHGAYSEDTNYLGALCGTSGYVTFSQLRAALDKIPGKKIVLLDSCHSGAHIGKSMTIDGDLMVVDKSVMQSYNSAAIAAFSSRSKANLAASDYYVITASHSSTTSLSLGNGSKWVGLFTWGLLDGSGYDIWNNAVLSSLNGDRNGDSQISLQEAYSYSYSFAVNRGYEQEAQVYPSNSSFVLWGQ